MNLFKTAGTEVILPLTATIHRSCRLLPPRTHFPSLRVQIISFRLRRMRGQVLLGAEQLLKVIRAFIIAFARTVADQSKLQVFRT
jgi:hypothetical protein